MMPAFAFLFFVFVFFSSEMMGQDPGRIYEDSSLANTIIAYQQMNADPEYMLDGWRILIQVSRDRRKVEVDKKRMERLYPRLEANMVFEDPYYKLYCCAFRTKQELRSMLAALRKDFPGAFEVSSKVSNEELYKTLSNSMP